MIRLTEQQVLSVHSRMIEMTGGSDGVRDKSLLDSALNVPFQTFDGKDIYPALLSKAAVMCRSIFSNHPFVDGNKRTGIHVMLIGHLSKSEPPKFRQWQVFCYNPFYNAILWLFNLDFKMDTKIKTSQNRMQTMKKDGVRTSESDLRYGKSS